MKSINKLKFKEMLQAGEANLNNNIDLVNDLNVFPVPDGDTGTNMHMTIKSGIEKILNEEKSIDEITSSLASGMLLGARGNSGVILSQFFRGLSKGLTSTEQITISEFQNALILGKEAAYDSVIKAVEGTILTVITAMSKHDIADEQDFINYFNTIIKIGNEALEDTPNLLPVLKEAGVVDSGGKGLMTILEGMQASLLGEKIQSINVQSSTHKSSEFKINEKDIKFGFCTEMLIRLSQDIDIQEVRRYLSEYGDSIIAIEDSGILKVHIHTERPLEVLAYGHKLGEFVNIKSENMRVQAENVKKENLKLKEKGIVIVASSEKMAKIFKQIQDVEVVLGGQTLNPSTEDIAKAVKNTGAKNVLILPNNSNIIMSAEATISIFDDKYIKVLKTKHMTEGLECLINYDPSQDLENNYENLNELLQGIINIEITKSIRDTSINNIEIKKDDFLIIKNGDIVDSVSTSDKLISTILENLEVEDIDLINILNGKTGNKKFLKKFKKEVEKMDDYLEVEIYETEQPVYDYLISGIK